MIKKEFDTMNMTKKESWLLVVVFLLSVGSSYAQKKTKAFFSIDNYTEEKAKAYFDANELHSIEGIWQDEWGDKYAIERFEDEAKSNTVRYRMIVLSYNDRDYRDITPDVKFFKPGYVRAFIDPAAVQYTYSITYYTRDELGIIRTYPFVGMEYTTYFSISSSNGEKRLFKIYPQHKVAPEGKSDRTNQDSPQGSGTAFALSSDGYLATCYHLIEDAKTVHITGINGHFDKVYQAQVVLKDAPNDLAVLKITDPEFTTLGPVYSKLRTVPAQIGESCFAMGYPLLDLTGSSIKFTSGDISAITGSQRSNCYQFSATVTHGNSGGPLYDRSGNIVGIVISGLRVQNNFNYAIKSSYLKALLEALPEKTIEETGVEGSTEQLSEIAARLKNNVFLVYANLNDETRQKIATLSPDQPTVNADKPLEKGSFMSAYDIKSAFDKEDYKTALTGLENPNKKLTNDELLMLGFLYIYYQKDYEKAVKTLNEAELTIKDDLRIPFMRGIAYRLQGKHMDAIRDMSTIIRMDPERSDAYFLRAQLKSSMGDPNGAMNDLDKAISFFDPKKNSYFELTEAYNARVRCLIDCKRYSDAMIEINKVIAKNSEVAILWETKGYISFLQNLDSQAIMAFDKSLKLSPSGEAYYYRGYAKYRLKKNEEALADLSLAGDYGIKEAFDLIKKINQ